MAWNPQQETYGEYLDRTGGGDQSDIDPNAPATAPAYQAPVAAQPAPAPAAAPSSPLGALAANPAFAAFMRASGLSNQLATADAAQRTLAFDQALGIGTEDINESGRRERRSIAGSHESRGTFRSGQHQTENLEALQDQARRRAALEMAAADNKSQLQTILTGSIAGNLTEGSELGLGVGEKDAYDLGYRQLLARRGA